LDKLQSLATSINSSINKESQGKQDLVKAFSVDASDVQSVRNFVRQASKAWTTDTNIHVGIWNPNAGFGIRPFQQWSEQQVAEAYQVQV